MVLAEKVSEKVVTMTAPETIVEDREQVRRPRLQVVSQRSIILGDYDDVTFLP
jgi:hypothetical protein